MMKLSLVFLMIFLYLLISLVDPKYFLKFLKTPINRGGIVILAFVAFLAFVGTFPGTGASAKKEPEPDYNYQKTMTKAEMDDAKANEPEVITDPDVISSNFAKFVRDFNGMTQIQKDDYWTKVQGKYVQWTGSVHNVDVTGVDLKALYNSTSFDFNASLTDKDLLLSLNKGDQITVKGKLNTKDGFFLSWGLVDCTIIK